MIAGILRALAFGWLLTGHAAAQAVEVYSSAETFSEPELGLVRAIQAGDEAGARERLTAGLDLNRAIAPPAAFDFKRIFGLSPIQRKMADALTPAPSGGRASETLTILNFFIANDDLRAMRLALKLGANPEAQGSFYYDAFRFSSEFGSADALDLLLQAEPFSKMSDDDQVRRLADLPKIRTVNHWFSDTEYQLDPSLLEVANRHHANFNLRMDDWARGTLLTNNMNLMGYGTVLWLLRNTDADPRLADRHGRTVASMAADWLKGIRPDDRYRKRMLLEIQAALAAKGVPAD